MVRRRVPGRASEPVTRYLEGLFGHDEPPAADDDFVPPPDFVHHQWMEVNERGTRVSYECSRAGCAATKRWNGVEHQLDEVGRSSCGGNPVMTF